MKELNGINFNISSCKPTVFSVFLHRCQQKGYKNFQWTSRQLLSNYVFFLQVSEVKRKLEELSLKGWIYPWHTTGKLQFLFSGSRLLVLTKFSFWEEDWTLGYNYMKFWHYSELVRQLVYAGLLPIIRLRFTCGERKIR